MSPAMMNKTTRFLFSRLSVVMLVYPAQTSWPHGMGCKQHSELKWIPAADSRNNTSLLDNPGLGSRNWLRPSCQRTTRWWLRSRSLYLLPYRGHRTIHPVNWEALGLYGTVRWSRCEPCLCKTEYTAVSQFPKVSESSFEFIQFVFNSLDVCQDWGVRTCFSLTWRPSCLPSFQHKWLLRSGLEIGVWS